MISPFELEPQIKAYHKFMEINEMEKEIEKFIFRRIGELKAQHQDKYAKVARKEHLTQRIELLENLKDALFNY